MSASSSDGSCPSTGSTGAVYQRRRVAFCIDHRVSLDARFAAQREGNPLAIDQVGSPLAAPEQHRNTLRHRDRHRFRQSHVDGYCRKLRKSFFEAGLEGAGINGENRRPIQIQDSIDIAAAQALQARDLGLFHEKKRGEDQNW